ncbi:F-box/LRR-repeat protein At1g67190-like [Juglans microcarpa x Juglans regia]|uniref:F-box/LRR-repeat protein At1g67190-like n=1 Tax=Juglans microcarpa x Juglans regia TaxID=2249226 RepID=UPI001B7EB69A|nr:F-box/LRR-repeat protein At1g67190-like [Juglans microcarpa x Juglans regia]
MEHLPVEVVGNILSRLGAARDVVIASATCCKWREAYHKHLHTLSFNSNDWPVYRDMKTSRLQILITQTIFQTTGLKGLYILMDGVDKFSASTVIAWLMYTRETLRRLVYNVQTTPSINILEICGRQKLETLVLAHNSITGVEPNFQRFPCLKSLSLSNVSISAMDLSLLLSSCQKIETLKLVNPEIAMSDAQVTVELSSPTVKSIYVEAVSLDKFVLEADSIECLHLKGCALEVFELVGKGTLKHFKIDDVSVLHLDIGENFENLEIVDISNFSILWPKFYNIVLRSSKLRRLRLCEVVFDEEDEVVDLERIAVCFPQLTHLSLRYDFRDNIALSYLEGSSDLVNVTVLELSWHVIDEFFSFWVEEMLKRFPNLKKMVIHGLISEARREDYQILANFTSFIVELMRKYMHLEVRFEFE